MGFDLWKWLEEGGKLSSNEYAFLKKLVLSKKQELEKTMLSTLDVTGEDGLKLVAERNDCDILIKKLHCWYLVTKNRGE